MTRRHERIVWVLAALALADLSALVTGRGAARALDEAFALAADSEVGDADLDRAPDGNREGWSCDGYIALTFDDGPHPASTPWLLDELETYGLRATFFVIGRQVERFPELARRIAAEGHDLANHTYDHPDLRRLGDGAIETQLRVTNEIVTAAAGVTPHWFRPPFGATNDRVRAQVEANGMTEVIWSLDTHDWRSSVVEADVVAALTAAEDGDVVLAHDRGKANTPGAIAAVAADLETRGLCSGELALADGSADSGDGDGGDGGEPILGIEGLTVRPWGSS
jgi:peptidoglycan/xylan/chitin deacetylase (PgdA/CDA1 family)